MSDERNRERDGYAAWDGRSPCGLAAMGIAAVGGQDSSAGREATGASRQGAAGPISTDYRGPAPRLWPHERRAGGRVDHSPPIWARFSLEMGKTPEGTEAGLCRQDASGMTTASGLEIGERGATLERRPQVTPDAEQTMASRLARESDTARLPRSDLRPAARPRTCRKPDGGSRQTAGIGTDKGRDLPVVAAIRAGMAGARRLCIRRLLLRFLRAVCGR